MRVLTGIQPSGQLHLGNYFGAMKPMIDLVNSGEHEVFCFVANYHAMTTVQDAKLLRKNIEDVILDWVAAGLDPEKIFFYVQSDVPQVQELTWILQCLTPMGLLERATSYKDKIAKGTNATAGLFTYPVLMAADILIMQSEIVPVGKDQTQHLEMTRDLAEKFNLVYGETFTLPQGKISQEVAVVPGIDGQKMSKSYNNTIPLFGEPAQIRKKVMSIVTDSLAVEDKKDPDKCNVFALYKLFAEEQEINVMREKYERGGYGYGDAKKELWQKIEQAMTPIWQKRKELTEQKDFVENIRSTGGEKARKMAEKTMRKVRKKVGLV